jgi:hypothetical protein
MPERSISPHRPDANVSYADKQMQLDEQEKTVLDRQLNGFPSETDNGTVFAYATPFDVAVIIISCVSAIIAGALNPLLTVNIPTFNRCILRNIINADTRLPRLYMAS